MPDPQTSAVEPMTVSGDSDDSDDNGAPKISGRARSSSSAALRTGDVTASRAGATGVNGVFWRRLRKLIIIGFGWRLCGPLALLAYLNVAMCVLSGYLLTMVNATGNARALAPLFDGDMKGFDRAFADLLWLIGGACMLRVVSAAMGSFIRLKWRGALVTELHRRMLGRNNLLNYLSNVDCRVDNIDQRITQDVEAATLNAWNMIMGDGLSLGIVGGLASVATSVNQLVVAGFLPITSIFLYAFLMVSVTLLFMSPVVKLQFEQQLKEGAFRLVHARAKEFAESIVFYAGVDVERAAAAVAFDLVFSNFKNLIRWNVVLNFISDVGTHTLPILAWVVVTVLIDGEPPSNVAGNTTNATMPTLNGHPVSYKLVSETNGAIVAGGAAILSLIASVLTQLPIVAGTIHRVGHMVEVTKELSQELGDFDEETRIVVDADASTLRVQDLHFNTPDGSKTLFDRINFEVGRGQSLLIMGPSGSGKTSLLRIVAGLCPFQRGTVIRPSSLFFLPQRPYLPLGTMRQQVLYPTTKNIDPETDIKIKSLLQEVGLGHIVTDFGLDAIIEWTAVLSGGELQRLSFARMLFHEPEFAIMDEATSALDEKFEDDCMKLCEAAGITAISVGHRPSLLQYHKNVLLLDGTAGARIVPAGDLRQPADEQRSEITDLIIPTGGSSSSSETTVVEIPANTRSRMTSRGGCFRYCCPRFAFVCGSGFAARGCGLTRTSMYAFGAILCGVVNAVGQLISTTVLTPSAMDALAEGRRPWGTILGTLAMTGFQLVAAQLNFYLAGMTALTWRKSIVRRLERMYFRGKVLYTVNNIIQVENADQRLAADPADFATFAATLFSSKGIIISLMQAAIFGVIASSTSGAIVLRIMYLALTAMAVSSLLMLWVAFMTFKRNAMEGNFRRVHSRIAEFAESIAFYGGEEAERERADREYSRLERIYMIFILAKNSMQGVALIVLTSTPFIVIKLYLGVYPVEEGHKPDRKDILGILGALVGFASMLLKQPGLWGMFAPAFGLVSRIGELAVHCEDQDDDEDDPAAEDRDGWSAANRSGSETNSTIYDDAVVKVEDLTCDTPDRTKQLFENFSFEVAKGSSVMIMGPSGSGKTSLLRILGGLWPVRAGRITRPDARCGKLMFLPQRPYIALGSLRQQIMYPRMEALSEDSVTVYAQEDEKIETLLQQLNLQHLLVYPGGLNAVKDWANILSGGEQQRLAFARLFYHVPEFVLMDEATAALDVKMEEICMRMCSHLGVTTISVGHRPTLKAFHDQIIHLQPSSDLR